VAASGKSANNRPHVILDSTHLTWNPSTQVDRDSHSHYGTWAPLNMAKFLFCW
jgi:hypothetical protein